MNDYVDTCEHCDAPLIDAPGGEVRCGDACQPELPNPTTLPPVPAVSADGYAAPATPADRRSAVVAHLDRQGRAMAAAYRAELREYGRC